MSYQRCKKLPWTSSMTPFKANMRFCCQLCCQTFPPRKQEVRKTACRAIWQNGTYKQVQNLSTGIARLYLSTEVYPKLKILPHIPFLSISVVCCLPVFLSIFLSEKTTQRKPQRACRVIPLPLADNKRSLYLEGRFFQIQASFQTWGCFFFTISLLFITLEASLANIPSESTEITLASL